MTTADEHVVSHISDAMAASVGALVDWRVSFPVSESDIRRWAIAVYFPEPPPRRYWDHDFAREESGGITAPEEFNPFAWMVAEKMVPPIVPEFRDPDKPEKHMGIAGPGLVNQINGGSEVTYGVPMRPGDIIRSETRLRSYRERRGRMGLMLITEFDDTWTNQHGETVQVGVNTSIRY